MICQLILRYIKIQTINSIAHCHSKYATSWAQASRPIPLLGTTPADFWSGDVPLVKYIKKKFLNKYESITGKLICNKLIKDKIDLKFALVYWLQAMDNFHGQPQLKISFKFTIN